MFELNGKIYTLDQVNESARRSNLDVNEYIKRAGLKKVEDQKQEQVEKPKDPKVEQAIKTRKALSEFSLTQDEILNNRKKYEEEANKFFVPKDQFPTKQEAISAGIGSPGYITEKKVAPFDGYNTYVNQAKKSINKTDASEDEVLNVAKELYIKDREKQAFTDKLNSLALTGDLRGEDTERKLKRITTAGKAVYETDQEIQDRFLADQEEASKVLSEYFKQDLSEKQVVLDEYSEKLKSLDELASNLISKKYFTEDEVNKANSYLSVLNKQKQVIAEDYKKIYDDMLNVAIDYNQNEAILDIVKRSYEPSKVFARKTAASTLDLASGVLMIPEWMTIKISEEFSDMDKPLVVKGTSYLSKQLKKASTALRESVEKPIDIQDVNSVSEMGSWAIDLVANQLPIVATLAAMPTAGLSVLGASAAGNKYSEMLDEEFYADKDYSNIQLLTAPLLVGGAEYLSERITLGQLNGIKKLAAKNNSVLDSAKDFLKNRFTTLKVVQNIAEESGSEVAATLAENATDILILNKEDVHIWDNVPNAAASGAFMSGVVFNSPLIGAKLMSPFMGEDINAKLRGNKAMINKISAELAKDNLDSPTRVQLEKALKDVIVDSNRIVAKQYELIDDLNYDQYGEQRAKELIDIDAKKEVINAQVTKILTNENLDEETKDNLAADLEKEFATLSQRKKQIIDVARKKAKDPYYDLSEQEFDDLMEKDIAKTADYLQSFGLDNVEQKVVDGIDEQKELLREIGASDDFIKKVVRSQPSGFLYTSGDKSYLIADRTAMKKRKKMNTSEHEFFHAVLLSSFRFNPDLQKKAGSELLSYLSGYINKSGDLQNTEFGLLIERYKKAAAEGTITYPQAMEEVFTLLSDAFTRKTISYNPGLLENVGNYVRRALQRAGVKDIQLDTAEDLFKFVADFNYNYKNNSFGKAFKKFAQQGLLSANQITVDNVENVGKFDSDLKSLNAKVDALVGEKDANGNYTVTKKEWGRAGIQKAYQEIIIGNMLDGLILAGYQGPTIYGQPKENFIEDIKYRKNGLADMIVKFNPEVNNSLIGWINNQLRNRKLDVESEFRIKLQESPITAEMERTQLATDEIQEDFMEVQEDLNRIGNLINASDIIGDINEEFNRKIKDVDLYSLYFRNVPNLVSETLSNVTGLAENKILNPADNLSTEEFKTGRKYIYDNLDVIMKILPESNITEQASIEFAGKSTGVPKSLLEVLYQKKTEKAGYAKADISKFDALAAFGINPDGSNIEEVSPRSKEAQRVKAIISLVGKLATNTKIRQHMQKIGMPIKNIVDIEAGKSRFMMDLGDLSNRDKILDNENLLVYKTLVLNDKELTDIYTAKQVDENKALEILRSNGLSKEQAADLHRSILNYSPKENIQRLKSDNRFIESYRKSFDYEIYQKEAAIKEQLNIVGVDLDVNSDVMRGKIIEELLLPVADKLIKSNLDNIQSQSAIIKLIYDNFFTNNNANILNDQGEVIGTVQQENRISLFKDNKEFSLFINEILNTNKSDLSLRFDAKGNLVVIKDKSSSRRFAQQEFVKLSPDENKVVYNIVSGHGSFVKSKTQRIGLNEFHNGVKDKQVILTAQNNEVDKAKRVFKQFLLALDDVKNGAFNKNSYKNSDAFDNKTLASFMLLLSSKPHNYLNYLYSVKDITRNEGVPDKITQDQAKRFYDFKTNMPMVDVMKFMTLYMSDTDVDISSLEGLLNSLNGEFVPSTLEVRTIKKDKEALAKKKKEQETKFVEKLAPEAAKPMTEEEIRNRSLEDKLALLISSKDPRITPGKVISKIEAEKMEQYYKPKSGTIISPEIGDFHTLMQVFYRDGKLGEQDQQWFEDNLNRKFAEASLKLDSLRQRVSIDFKNVSAAHPRAVKALKDPAPFLGFINDDAVKVYIYYKAGYGEDLFLDQDKVRLFVNYIEKNQELKAYADDLMSIYPGQGKWIEPNADWQNRLIKEDVLNFVEKELRKEVFADWISAKEAIFSKNNLNKILAVYGQRYYGALMDSLYRMETGSTNVQYASKAERMVFSYLRSSIGVTMFWNTRSALLQLISTFNYIDLESNNIVDVYNRMSDTKQWTKDIAFIFNSDYLLQRRGGLRTDIQEQEIINAIEKGGLRGLYKKIMAKGFTLTKFGDSAAISFLGATYYRTRVIKYNDFLNSLPETFTKDKPTSNQDIINTIYKKVTNDKGEIINYVKINRSQNDKVYNKLAEKLAFIDFYEKTEESQQSARPDRISKQQTTMWGRLLLAYQNTVLQYNRVIFRDLKDIYAGRGNRSKKLARVAYYAAIQNVAFNFFQSIWLGFLFNNDEEEELIFDDKWLRLFNSTIDTLIRGFGIWGGIGSALKNTILEGVRQAEKQEQGGIRRTEYVLLQALSMSPVISSKYRQFASAYNNVVDQRDLYKEMGLDLYNPMFDAIAQAGAVAGVPTNRALQKLRNLEQVISKQDNAFKNILYLLGYNTYDFKYKDPKLEEIKFKIKKNKQNKSSRSTRKIVKRKVIRR